MTRRTLMGTLAVAASVQAQKTPKEWKPKLGLLGPFTEANVEFARQEGFTNMILGASPRSTSCHSAASITRGTGSTWNASAVSPEPKLTPSSSTPAVTAPASPARSSPPRRVSSSR